MLDCTIRLSEPHLWLKILTLGKCWLFSLSYLSFSSLVSFARADSWRTKMKRKPMSTTAVARTESTISTMIETATTCANITTLKVNKAVTLTVAWTEAVRKRRASVADSIPCQTGHRRRTASLRVSILHSATSKAVLTLHFWIIAMTQTASILVKSSDY